MFENFKSYNDVFKAIGDTSVDIQRLCDLQIFVIYDVVILRCSGIVLRVLKSK